MALLRRSSYNIWKLEQLLKAKRAQLHALSDVTKAINENLPEKALFSLFEQIVIEHLEVKQIAFYIRDRTWKNTICVDAEDVCKLINIEKLVDKYKAPSELSFMDKRNYSGFKYVIPVYHENKAIAFCLLGKLNTSREMDQQESLEFAQTITSIIAVAVENQKLFRRNEAKKLIKQELDIAAKVQKMLVPNKLPQNNLYEFFGIYIPHHGIGGDYYDVINLNNNEIVFCIADISGKGIAAALIMANLQAYLNAFDDITLDERFIQKLNNKIYSITNGERFITLFIAKYNILTKELYYVNAGHNPPILYNEEGEILLKEGCTLLGMFEEIPKISFGKVHIIPNTTIVCYTDGITELADEHNQQYSSKRLRLFTRKNYRLGPEVFTKTLYDNITKYKGTTLFNDDVSVLCCKFL